MPADAHATPPLPGLSPVEGKPIIARFDGGSLSSDGGLLALCEVEARLGMARRLAACIDDPRMPERIQHNLADMLRFRILMIAAGYEAATTPTACATTRCSSSPTGACPTRPRSVRSRRCRALRTRRGRAR
jgi:Transposase DDE domain group 1